MKLFQSVYSNFDHILDLTVVEEMKRDGFARCHPAENFCGYIQFEGGVFVEYVYQHGTPVDEIRGENIMDVIDEVNEKWGDE
jgi:hypothetical protein